jgi:membrane-associated phospholipid phosphatase
VRTLLLALTLLNPVVDLDWTVQREVQGLRSPGLERPMRALTDIGRPAYVFGALLGVAMLDRAAGPATARLAILVLAATNIVVEVTKRTFNRARPDGEHKGSNASFPSSHAANAFALAAVFARRWRRLALPFFVWAAATAWSRMYLNRHFLSDVVVGAAVGILCAWLLGRWLGKRLEWKRRA